MKTTIQIADSVLEEAKKIAAKEHITLKELVEDGLRKVISDRGEKGSFRLRKASFKGKGLQPQFAGASWEKIREAVYERRGA